MTEVAPSVEENVAAVNVFHSAPGLNSAFRPRVVLAKVDVFNEAPGVNVYLEAGDGIDYPAIEYLDLPARIFD